MYIRRGTPLEPLIFGGAQDRGRRPGTENVALAVGLALAAELALARARARVRARWARCATRSRRALLARIPDAVIHGRGAPRAPHIMNVSVPGIDSESLLMALDLRGIACSARSACQSGQRDAVARADRHGRAAATSRRRAIRHEPRLPHDDACSRPRGRVFPALVEKARGRVRGAGVVAA